MKIQGFSENCVIYLTNFSWSYLLDEKQSNFPNQSNDILARETLNHGKSVPGYNPNGKWMIARNCIGTMAVIIFGQFGSPNQWQSKAANCNGVTSKSMPSQSRVYVLIETVQTGLNGVSVVRDWMGHHNGILTVNSPAPPPHFQPSPLLRDTANGCWMRYLLPAVIEFTSLLNFYVPRNRRRVIRGLPFALFFSPLNNIHLEKEI